MTVSSKIGSPKKRKTSPARMQLSRLKQKLLSNSLKKNKQKLRKKPMLLLLGTKREELRETRWQIEKRKLLNLIRANSISIRNRRELINLPLLLKV